MKPEDDPIMTTSTHQCQLPCQMPDAEYSGHCMWTDEHGGIYHMSWQLCHEANRDVVLHYDAPIIR